MRHLRGSLFLSIGLLVAISSPLHADTIYHITTIGLGINSPVFAVPTGINNYGAIAGYLVNSAALGDQELYAFVYGSGGVYDLGAYGGDKGAMAFGINDSGQVLIDPYTNDTATQALIYDSTTHTTTLIPLRGGSLNSTYGSAINNSGQVVGASTPANYAYAQDNAVLYSNGALTDLTSGACPPCYSIAWGINNNGQILGESWSSAPFLYGPPVTPTYWLDTNGQFANLNFTPLGLDDQGDVLLQKSNGDVALWNNGSVTDLGFAGTPAVISQNGAIAGYLPDGSMFVYSGGMMSRVDVSNNTGWNLAPGGHGIAGLTMSMQWVSGPSFITGINNSGQIIGAAEYSPSAPYVLEGFLLSPGASGGSGGTGSGGPTSTTPEPAATALLIAACAALIFVYRRRAHLRA